MIFKISVLVLFTFHGWGENDEVFVEKFSILHQGQARIIGRLE